jgi:hypothetical protein
MVITTMVTINFDLFLGAGSELNEFVVFSVGVVG